MILKKIIETPFRYLFVLSSGCSPTGKVCDEIIKLKEDLSVLPQFEESENKYIGSYN